jgi:hypothetical protein
MPASAEQSAAELERELAAVSKASRGLYAAAHSSPQGAPKVTRKNKIVLGEFENKTGDPVIRRNSSPRFVCATRAVPFSGSRLGSTGSASIAFYAPAAGDAPHYRSRAGNLRENGRHGRPGRLDCKPWKPVRVVVTRQELPHRRYSWPGAGGGGDKGRGSGCAYSDCGSN